MDGAMDNDLYYVERLVLQELKGAFVSVSSEADRIGMIEKAAKRAKPGITDDQIKEIAKDVRDLGPLSEALDMEGVEDIMINNTSNIFVYDSQIGERRLDKKVRDRRELDMLVDKLKLFATNEISGDKILDVHMPDGSRANIVTSPVGYDITIRRFRGKAMSIIDLINMDELDYQIAARLWIYMDGFKVRPANMLIGGMPASGKTTLLNALFSFLRPDARVVTIEETYELNTKTQENCVRLETSSDMPMEELVKNALRMRPDMIIIGEVRGAEANDMITAMNIGKICMGTIHASSARDIINRLQNFPMDVPKDIIPVIDSLITLSQVYENGKPKRRVTQIAEISGIETQILLSDLYRFDYKTHKAAPILPSVTYRDMISDLLGIPPATLMAAEDIRANVLYALNKMGIRDIEGISGIVDDYYLNPEAALRKLGLASLSPAITI